MQPFPFFQQLGPVFLVLGVRYAALPRAYLGALWRRKIPNALRTAIGIDDESHFRLADRLVQTFQLTKAAAYAVILDL
jgi:hypothetical protein